MGDKETAHGLPWDAETLQRLHEALDDKHSAHREEVATQYKVTLFEMSARLTAMQASVCRRLRLVLALAHRDERFLPEWRAVGEAEEYIQSARESMFRLSQCLDVLEAIVRKGSVGMTLAAILSLLF